MSWHHGKNADVDQLLLNARLRDEIEPYLDESVMVIDTKRMSTRTENEFLASMLAWERAPILPICQWFEPELQLPSPDTLEPDQLHQQLHQLIGRLFEKNIVLEYTEHLSDRQLYCIIARDILPAQEKRIGLAGSYLVWQCIDQVDDEDDYLRYYATDEERQAWAEETAKPLPDRVPLPYSRSLPRAPGASQS
jgi:hypothetical protein